MKESSEQFDGWTNVLAHKARILHSQVAQIERNLSEAGASPETIAIVTEPYFELLYSLYTEDYPLANALENSDLVIRLQGISVDKDRPRVSVITSYFDKVRKQITSIAKAIANLEEDHRRIPKQFDLTLSAYAKGSLVLGFSLPTDQDLEEANQPTLFGTNDVLFKAAREAIKTLGVVSHFVAEDAPIETIAEAVPDPKVRDIALAAVSDLAPSGRLGISSVAIAGKDIGQFEKGLLTKEKREKVRKALEHPVKSEEAVTFHGRVREIDLDASRFELRDIENLEENEVRCVYRGYTDNVAAEWINKVVTVTGKVDRDAGGKARLMEIEDIKIKID